MTPYISNSDTKALMSWKGTVPLPFEKQVEQEIERMVERDLAALSTSGPIRYGPGLYEQMRTGGRNIKHDPGALSLEQLKEALTEMFHPKSKNKRIPLDWNTDNYTILAEFIKSTS
jgi:hypothetical protein